MNIVICCDGTGNEFGVKNSNVIKLFSALDKNQKKNTLYYHPGIGTIGIIFSPRSGPRSTAGWRRPSALASARMWRIATASS